ncbi:IPT/TIG domain-containing protein [Streptomyces sp. NPDC020845]|uniref:IPT/TIG domain-containing protein n=1 Tax=Streptomyces sp. NPDC020845 TaxID=3365096 RepID=UPI0037B6C4FE
MAPPVVTGVNPAQGSPSGGTTVTITGTGLTGATQVRFGFSFATNVVVVNDTQITAKTPAGSGTVNVTVTTPNGTSTQTVPFTYTTTPAPVLSSLNPTSGPTTGTNTVTINGSNLTGATQVLFGSNPGAILTNTAAQITVIAPSGTGTVNVTVTTPGGTSNPLAYTYTATPAPHLNNLSPTSGPISGGNTVTIYGSDLSGATHVLFGSNPATILTNGANQISVAAPAGPPSAVNVTVTTPGGTSNPLPYFYIAAPTVTDLYPHSGPDTGANTVTVFGTNLTLTSVVKFGNNPASNINVISDGQLTVTAPSGSGTVVVTVTTPGGTSTVGTGGAYYTYLGAPVVNTLNPPHGPDYGGNPVTLTGANLTYTDSVTFGGVEASFAAISDSQVVAVAPGGSPGSVDVRAHTPAGYSNLIPYLYEVS